MIYRSLKNEKYLCKSDLFPILQNMVFGGMNEFINVMAIFLKSQEPSDCMEFVRFDEKVLEEIAEELHAEGWQKQVNISVSDLEYGGKVRTYNEPRVLHHTCNGPGRVTVQKFENLNFFEIFF